MTIFQWDIELRNRKNRPNVPNGRKRKPDKVKVVLDRIKTDGLMTTVEAVRSELDTSVPLGYCNFGEGTEGIEIGDRVAINRTHAEVVSVPANLYQHAPTGVEDEVASFTVSSAIALQRGLSGQADPGRELRCDRI